MKFNSINKKKMLVILLSSFVITSLSGCKNNSYNDSNIPTYNKVESEISNDTNVENTPSKETITQDEYSENDVLIINEFETLEKQIDNLIESGDNILDKAKGIFITTIDFIFYDSEINGVKFNDLTDTGKQKILEISTNIDSKIENKFPNYKDEISEAAKDALNKASELIKKGANNINEFAKEKLDINDYNNLIKAKDELVEYSKKTFDIIGDVSSDLYDTNKQKIKNWYEHLKNN